MDEKRTGYISIGEMAKMNRTTVPTLRLYDSMKLLTPCYVDEKTHYRYYDIKQNARLDMIQYMKELGIELKEIKSILDRKDLDLIEDVLMQKREQTLQEMEELKFKWRRSTGLWHRSSVTKNPLQVELLRWSTFRIVPFIP